MTISSPLPRRNMATNPRARASTTPAQLRLLCSFLTATSILPKRQRACMNADHAVGEVSFCVTNDPHHPGSESRACPLPQPLPWALEMQKLEASVSSDSMLALPDPPTAGMFPWKGRIDRAAPYITDLRGVSHVQKKGSYILPFEAVT